MPRTSRRQAQSAQADAPILRCEAAGCEGAGEYRAPRQRGGGEAGYILLCLDHIRAFNKGYDYFSGMNEQAILAFMKDAVTGHRPTWRMGHTPDDGLFALEEALRRFRAGEADGRVRASAAEAFLPEAVREALALFGMTHPLTPPMLKRQYRLLVKRHHPDVNPGADAAEHFKRILSAYETLKGHYASEEVVQPASG